MEDSMNLHENREVFVTDFESVWESLQPVYERELSNLAYRPLPGSEEVVASFKTIVGLLLK